MGSVQSTLIMSMLDRTTATSRRIRRELHGLDTDARRAQRAVNGAAAVTRGALGKAGVASLLAGGGKMLAGGVGAYLGASVARNAYSGFADFERQISRIMNTAGATRAEADAAKNAIYDIAKQTKLPISEVLSGLQSLVAAGTSLPDAMAFLPSVAMTAQGAGAAVTDMASTSDALARSLGISAEKMQDAFDILVEGGNAGKFEANDMARYLASLAPAAAAIGLKGEDGLRKLTAALQVVRTQTGQSSEAATNMRNVFQKMETDETAKKFKNFGVDLRKEMARARKDGKDLFETFLNLANRAVKGDLSKLPQLFSDQEVHQGMRALLSQRDMYDSLIRHLQNVKGASKTAFDNVANDAQAAMTNIDNAWNRTMASMARAADNAGVSTLLNGVAGGLDVLSRTLENKAAGKTTEENLRDQMKALGYSDAVANTVVERMIAAPRKGLEISELTRRSDTAAFKLKRLQESEDAINRTNGDAPAEYSRLSGIANPTVQQRIALEMARRQAQYYAEEMVRIRAERHSVQAEYEAMTSQLVDAYVGSPGYPVALPHEFAPPSPQAKPAREIPLPPAKPVAVRTGVDEASVMAAADEIRRKAQEYVNRNPITIPVKAGSVEGIMRAIDRQLQSDMDGSFSDNGGRR